MTPQIRCTCFSGCLPSFLAVPQPFCSFRDSAPPCDAKACIPFSETSLNGTFSFLYLPANLAEAKLTLQFMERETEAQDNTWRTRLDAVLMHKIWGVLIFLCVVYVLFFLSFAIGDPLVRLIQKGTQLFSMEICQILTPWPSLQSMLGEGVIGGVGGILAFMPNVVLLFGAITILESSGYMIRVSRLMARIMKIMGLNGSSFAPLLLGFGCSVPAILATRRIPARNERLVTISVLPMMSCAGRLPIYMMFVSALFPSHLQATVLFLIYASGVLLALCCARFLKNTLFKTVPQEMPTYVRRLRIPSLSRVGMLMWDRAFMYVRKAGSFILAASIILWFLNTYPAPEQESAPNRATAMEHSYAGQIGQWMEPATKVAGFDWKVNSALLGAFAAKEIFVTQMGILYAVEDGDSGTAAQQTLNTRLKENYTPLQGISIMIFCLIALPCIGTVTVAKREAGTWWFACAQFTGLTLLGFLAATSVYQIGVLL